MEETQVQSAVRRRLGLRIGPEMAAYLERRFRRVSADAGAKVPVMAVDARTGIPIRTELPAETLREVLGL